MSRSLGYILLEGLKETWLIMSIGIILFTILIILYFKRESKGGNK